MDLLSLALSLSLPLQGGQFTGDYSFDVNPTIGIPFPTGQWGATATTLPGVILHDPEMAKLSWGNDIRNPELLRHELMHVEQQAALGPAFLPAYLLTAGSAFEPYDPLHEFFGLPSSPNRPTHNDYDQMWMPDESMRGQYPLFRLARDEGRTRLQFMPGYPGVTIE